jgi:spore maturation protein CgeB
MSYRFVKITTFYREFLEYYYLSNPGIQDRPYGEQYRHLMDMKHAWSDFFQVHLKELGVEAFEIIYNAIPLQKAWAKEFNVPYSGKFIIRQLKVLQPEVVLFQDPLSFPGDFYINLRKEVPTIRILAGHSCSPFTREHLKIFSLFNFMLTCSPGFKTIFDRNNITSHLFYHGFESSLSQLVKIDNFYPDIQLLFIGSLVQRSEFHEDRIKLMESILSQGVDLTIYSKILTDSYISIGLKQAGFLVSRLMKKLGMNDMALKVPYLKKTAKLNEMPKMASYSKSLKESINPRPLFGLEMLKALSKAKIGWNIHAGVAGDYAVNMRMFEVTGTGGMLVTDSKSNMRELFEPGKEVITYSSADECIEKIKWYLDHPRERDIIAKAGHERTLQEHSLKSRVSLLNELIENCL